MTQLSRPFQIVLVTCGLFVLVWFVALRGHNSSAPGGSESRSSGSSAPKSTATPSAGAQGKSAAAPTHVYTGPVPGLQGLSRAIDKAHGAVAQSQTDAKRFEHAEPSGTSPQTTATGASPSAKSAAAAATAAAASHPQAASRSKSANGRAKSATSPAKSGGLTVPTMQLVVERELKQKKTVLIFFWSPRGTEDVAVRTQLPVVAHALGGTVAIHYSLPHEVTDYGRITNTVQVNQTPTILIVNTRGRTTTLTGLTDAFSIEQAVAEARKS